MFAESEQANADGRKSGLKLYFLLLMGLCFAGTLFVMVLSSGIESTPDTTTDSQGRPMGFVDRFSAEHYRIALGNFRPANLVALRSTYDWLLLLAILIGVWCVTSETRSTTRAARWYFLCQSVFFFPGLFSTVFFIWPQEALSLIRFEADHEYWDEFPMGWILGQGPWVVISLTIALTLPGPPLGLKQAWPKICRWMAHRNLIATDR